jgi:2-(1,2-epoxy-1,2-dihydrophenyl)acetyl-CoA isomerase
MTDTVLLERYEGVATVTLNRPDKLNAFNDEMLAGLTKHLKAVATDDTVRCVVLTGAGRGFSAGQDLASVRDRAASGGMRFREHLEHAYNPVILRLRTMEKPVLAAINGVAAGAGASLALACDLRIAASSASLIQAFVGVGLVPDTGSTWALTRLVGFSRAFELASSGRTVPAAEALALGLVNRVAPDEELRGAAAVWAAELASGPTKALGLTKRAMNRALTTSLDDALLYEAQLQEIAGRTADHAEGVAAFLGKRPPQFQGR